MVCPWQLLGEYLLRSSEKSANEITVRWIVSFFFFIAVAYFLSKDEFFVSHFNQLMISVQIRISSLLLYLLGFVHEVNQTVIVTPTRQFVVAESCSGLFVFLLLSAAVLSFPAPWLAKLEGFVAGALALVSLNIVRIVMIVILGSRFPESFWAFHVIAGQILVISGMAGVFLLWLVRIQTNSALSKMLLGKGLFYRLLLFTAGYAAGNLLYGLFLESLVGTVTADLVKEHTLIVLNLARDFFEDGDLSFVVPSISFNQGCLSSPMFVVFFALLTAWPCSWQKKGMIVLVGIVPSFYLYHLFRALVTGFSFLLGSAKESSIVYNCFGQFVLAAVFVISFWLYLFTGSGPQKSAVGLKQILAGLAAGAAASIAGGKIVTDYFLPNIIQWLFQGTLPVYDPQLSISTMAYFQFFIFYTLVWSTPAGYVRKLAVSMAGLIVLVMMVPLLVFTIGTFHLSPHVGVLKGFIICFPLVLYYSALGRRVARGDPI